MWKTRSDPVLHIELRRWADLLVIAPLDANTLGKIASGICDNLLVSMCFCKYGCVYPETLSGKNIHLCSVYLCARRIVSKWGLQT